LDDAPATQPAKEMMLMANIPHKPHRRSAAKQANFGEMLITTPAIAHWEQQLPE
jgi:hypothetical protein